MGLGAWTVAEKSFANELLGTNLYKGAIYILMIAGIFLPFISFLGCFGALKEVRCLLVSVSMHNKNVLKNLFMMSFSLKTLCTTCEYLIERFFILFYSCHVLRFSTSSLSS